MRWRAGCLAAALLAGIAAAAHAYIERLYAFQEILDESAFIVVGKFASVDGPKRIAVATIERPLRGKQEFKRVEMHIGLSAPDHASYVIGRIKPGAEVIGFYKRDGTAIASEWHAGGTWFQLYAEDEPGRSDAIAWRMSHIEIHLNRTYSGPTPDLVLLTEDVLAKRRPPPAPNPSLPPLDPSRPGSARLNPAVAKGGLRARLVYKCEGGEPGGIALADANADERLDIHACRGAANTLLINGGGSFEDMAVLLNLRKGSQAASWADYNGDGYVDVLMHAIRLYTNVGGGFREDSRLIPAAREGRGECVAWIDSNGDGLPDILVAGGPGGVRLFQNTGKAPNWFVDVTEKAGLGRKALADGPGHFFLSFDYDGDGYTDFLYNQGKGVLAHNERDGTFKLISGSGLEPCQPGYRCGPAAGDMDGDGRLDVFVPGPGKARLYRNNGDGTFTNVMEAAGDLAKMTEPSVSAAWADVDGDGRMDLLVCYPGGSPRLFLGDGKGGFTDVTDAVGLRGLDGVCSAAWADLNDDGYPDLVMNCRDKIIVAFNEMEHPKDRAAVTVTAHVAKGLTGALVRVMDERDRLLGLRELGGAEGLGGQACAVAHLAVPLGKCRISFCLSDGRMAQRTVTIEAGKHRAVFHEDEFK